MEKRFNVPLGAFASLGAQACMPADDGDRAARPGALIVAVTCGLCAIVVLAAHR